MASIFDYVNSQEIAAYIQAEPSNNVPYFGETLFPSKKQVGTDISWLTGNQGLPVLIEPSQYDAKATLRERTAFGKKETEMAFFRESMRIGEKDRQEINKLLNHPNSQIALPIIQNIFDDIKKLTDGVRARAEEIRMQLLQTGTINVTGVTSGASYKYDYGLTNKSTVAASWGESGSNPIKDIIDALDVVENKTGVRPSRLVMNRNTFIKLINDANVRGAMLPTWTAAQVAKALITETQLKSFVEEVTQCRIFVYSKKVATLDRSTGLASTTAKQLLDDNKVIFLPEGTIGNTWYGTTPEESDLLAGGSNASVSIINGGTAITTYKEVHPVNVVTVVSSVFIPSFEGIDNTYVLTTQA